MSETRQNILRAASAEFARAGFAGARMEKIATIAGIKKQVIYYYFPSKAELAREVLDWFDSNQEDFWQSMNTSTLSDVLHTAIDRGVRTSEGIAHLVWEGRENSHSTGLDISMSAHRQEDLLRIVGLIEREQTAGRLRTDIAPQILGLLLVLMTTSPAVLPQITRLLSGREWSDQKFTDEWKALLDAVLTSLAPSAGSSE